MKVPWLCLSLIALLPAHQSLQRLHDAITHVNLDTIKEIMAKNSCLLRSEMIEDIVDSDEAPAILTAVAESYVFIDNGMFCKAFKKIITFTVEEDYDVVPMLTTLASKWQPAENPITTPLVLAATSGDVTLVEALLQIPIIKESINRPVSGGNTAIFHANKPSILLSLLKAGADLNRTNDTGNTCFKVFAMSLSASRKYVEFHRSENWSSSDVYKYHDANIRIQRDMMQICVLYGADPTSQQAENASSSIMELIGEDCAGALQLLLDERLAIEARIAAVYEEFNLGVNESFIALLPPEIIEHLVMIMRKQPFIFAECIASKH